ncbi:tRNA (cytidine(34)-2'-O)-methyltransferase [Chryseobacterium indologenes]|uniref:Putative tRNA (cytidine(34)-2'-O)-methyltransferase n=1 Tax=Chryseobacterium indologenes TaxID=253 RepID=A0AAD1DU18_CHRID|nr:MULTISPECIES: tRNA (cytidine(34)-2'-O)-methyltransferase [Chryseobacterium]ASE60590.1 tRNA (cytidine(34)-2'-O)-methyltransferase [Chryseobacterium indologenes]AYZ36424.1 tRNA (cytidine(34)-2'-O)-methyltransferase [Chryseobacterium indologenes]AZB16348.1 tRNA (cytidine(34)-2'-O)-methyltransferase [Chryseobacterium indologenes]MBF6645089.1 tRNA (cytidine(34)-2'-O)-methyltransferase [Chryseobacterium indologenes]MBU3046550.1 tRNA (cytidine(34)-2'-O)-methyltransferase [Chryseobacterium indologe
MLNIVLVEPEIPNNTGNIGRLCVGTESRLHLIHPFGFVINDKNLKRSGLDYWVHLDVSEYDNVEEWMKKIPDLSRVFLMSSHAEKSYLDNEFQDGDWLVFGKESVGLSQEVLALFENHLTIPMSNLIRSFNIANSVAFVVGEAKRQINVKAGI